MSYCESIERVVGRAAVMGFLQSYVNTCCVRQIGQISVPRCLYYFIQKGKICVEVALNHRDCHTCWLSGEC